MVFFLRIILDIGKNITQYIENLPINYQQQNY